jgi:hypothetical protein
MHRFDNCIRLVTVAIAIALPFAGRALGQVIYQDDFSGSGTLNGAAPDVRPGTETWDATEWQADGTITSPAIGTGSNAFLPFAPVAGQIYTLSLDVNPTSAVDPTNWFALGFAPTSSPPGNYFATYSAGPWMLLRVQRDGYNTIPNDADDVGDIETFDGPIVNGFMDHDAPHGVVNFKIILDTTAAQWQADWLVNGTPIRSDAYATNPTINYVGFGRLFDATGAVDNFSLTAVPEPTSLALLAAGAAMLLFPLRRVPRHGPTLAQRT